MSDEEINIAIAEACDWKWRVGIYGDCRGLFHPDDGYLKGLECTEKQMIELPISSDCAIRVPNYCNDLNAMHEAEKRFLLSIARCELPLSKAKNEANSYFRQLKLVCDACDRAHPIHATARQRAEAFLRTLGNWKEAAK